MVLLAYNYSKCLVGCSSRINFFCLGDWPLFFENCTKFGLGLLSVCFDCIFLVQHYILFKASELKTKIENAVVYSNTQ